jgi:membrane protease YdiL (CAAX protease family)
MCLLYERTGSLWPPIAFHAAMNIVVLTLFTGTVAPVLIVLGTGFLLFLIAPWRFFRGRRGRAEAAAAA